MNQKYIPLRGPLSSPALDSRDKIEPEASTVPFLVPSSDADEYLTSCPTDDFLPCFGWGSKSARGFYPCYPSRDALGATIVSNNLLLLSLVLSQSYMGAFWVSLVVVCMPNSPNQLGLCDCLPKLVNFVGSSVGLTASMRLL
jgi:hypothetical protein